MARPKKNNAERFSHDADMRNHRKIRAIRTAFSAEWYAVFSMLLEVLCNAEFFTIPRNEEEAELLSGDFGVESWRLQDMVKYFVKLWLFSLENGNLHSSSLVERLEPLLDKREKARQKYEETRDSDTEKKWGKKPAKPKKEKTTMTAEQFDEFYSNYPQASNRKGAKEKFLTLEASLFPAIMAWLEKHKAGRRFKENVIPAPLVWLRQERRNDDVPPFIPSGSASNEANNQWKTQKDEGHADAVIL